MGEIKKVKEKSLTSNRYFHRRRKISYLLVAYLIHLQISEDLLHARLNFNRGIAVLYLNILQSIAMIRSLHLRKFQPIGSRDHHHPFMRFDNTLDCQFLCRTQCYSGLRTAIQPAAVSQGTYVRQVLFATLLAPPSKALHDLDRPRIPDRRPNLDSTRQTFCVTTG